MAVPYLVYMPEKDRLVMLVSCDYPHHAEVLFSDDRGGTWSLPKPAILGTDGKPVAALGTGLCYLGEGKLVLYADSSAVQPRLRPDLDGIRAAGADTRRKAVGHLGSADG